MKWSILQLKRNYLVDFLPFVAQKYLYHSFNNAAFDNLWGQISQLLEQG